MPKARQFDVLRQSDLEVRLLPSFIPIAASKQALETAISSVRIKLSTCAPSPPEASTMAIGRSSDRNRPKFRQCVRGGQNEYAGSMQLAAGNMPLVPGSERLPRADQSSHTGGSRRVTRKAPGGHAGGLLGGSFRALFVAPFAIEIT